MSVFRVFLICILQHLDWIRRDTEYLFVFSPNEGKHGPEKTGIQTYFTQWKPLVFRCFQGLWKETSNMKWVFSSMIFSIKRIQFDLLLLGPIWPWFLATHNNIHFTPSEKYRSSRSQMFLKFFVNVTGKHLCWSLLLIKLQAWWPAILLKRDSNTSVFLWNLQNF